MVKTSVNVIFLGSYSVSSCMEVGVVKKKRTGTCLSAKALVCKSEGQTAIHRYPYTSIRVWQKLVKFFYCYPKGDDFLLGKWQVVENHFNADIKMVSIGPGAHALEQACK
jgi:hypothetical protein